MNTAAPTSALEMRQHTRYELKRKEALTAHITYGVEDHGLQAHVLDVSKSGLKLQMSQPLPIRERATLRIVYDRAHAEFTVKATVCWARPMGADRWWVGCNLDAPYPSDHINLLSESGELDRRRDIRTAVDIPAFLQRELQPKPSEVRLLNLSAGGFMIQSPLAANRGERLLISFQGNESLKSKQVVARVEWSRPQQNGYRIGASFLNKTGYATCLQGMAQMTAIRPQPQRQTSWLMLTLAVATAAAGAVSAWSL